MSSGQSAAESQAQILRRGPVCVFPSWGLEHGDDVSLEMPGTSAWTLTQGKEGPRPGETPSSEEHLGQAVPAASPPWTLH